MMKLILILFVLLPVGALTVYVLGWLRRRAQEQALRDAPPRIERLLVRLPAEAEKSNQKMTRFFSRLERILPGDDDLIASNGNVIHAAIVGSGQAPGQSPTVRFMLWCPPALVERVQLELVECYEGEAQILELKDQDDPFFAWLDAYERRRAWEDAQRAAEQQAVPEDTAGHEDPDEEPRPARDLPADEPVTSPTPPRRPGPPPRPR